MANILKAESITDGIRYIVRFHLGSAKIAKYCESKYLMAVRDIFRMADLYANGSTLYLDTPSKEVTNYIAPLLKNEIINLNYIQ